MNKQQFELLKTIGSCDEDKTKFLLKLLTSASKSYDYAIERNAQRIQGGLDLSLVSEGHGHVNGERYISDGTESGGGLFTYVNHTFRERKTMKDFDWTNINSTETA